MSGFDSSMDKDIRGRNLKGKTVALETLGCKVNQYESSCLLQGLLEAGCTQVSFRQTADIYIVHSCAVTARAALQTRQLLRRARRLNPDALVIVAGCDAQIEPERIVRERLATHILGSDEKFDLVRWIETPGSFEKPCTAVFDSGSLSRFNGQAVSRMHTGRTRAFLKIQDGCNAFCSYCIVPYTRGRSRSLPSRNVVSRMGRFVGEGYHEVVITGIHLGQWGRDLEPREELWRLLTSCAEDPAPHRLRLSSLEPLEWNRQLIETLSSLPCICPHFHVPLQSGDDQVLRRMNRPYGARRYEEVILELRRLFPDAALGADVLVGFPGETEDQFLNTFRLVERLPLTYLHVFPFSPRPGTPASELPDRLGEEEMKRRTGLLQQLSISKKRQFRESFLGRTVEVLVESRTGSGLWQGTTPNYLRVLFPASAAASSGSLLNLRLTGLTETALIGEYPPTGS